MTNSHKFGGITRFAAIVLSVLFVTTLLVRLLGRFEDGVPLSALFDIAATLYLTAVMGYAGVTGRQPPAWLAPTLNREAKPIQIKPWAKRMGFAGLSLLIVGLLTWTGEIRSGVTDPPSAIEDFGVTMFMLGLVLCLPPALSIFIAVAESAIPDIPGRKDGEST